MKMLVLSLIFVVGAVDGLLNKNPYCDLKCDLGNSVFAQHTVCERKSNKCGPAMACGPNFKVIKLTNDQRQMILDNHNALRCRVALGNERRGHQLPAKNMRVMTYDPELEFIAQCWANACNGVALKHDSCRRTRKFEHVGQNLGYISSSADNINFTLSMQQLIHYWYEEVTLFRNEWVYDTRDRGVKVGHYTQMMWADTHKLGCAAVHYTTKQQYGSDWYEILLVCNYGPGGNYVGLPVYKPGTPGSGCSDKLKSNNGCGLCGRFVNVTEHSNFQPYFRS